MLLAELIEVRTKPSTPWGNVAQSAFGTVLARPGAGPACGRGSWLSVARTSTRRTSSRPPGITILGASSDHLVLDLAEHDAAVGDELAFGVGYSGLLRAMTSPFVSVSETRASALVVAVDEGVVA